LRDDSRRVIGGVSVLRDITEAKRAEDALRESEERLRAIVTTAADAIVTIDEQGIIESCNPAAERMFAYPAHQMIGQDIQMLMPSPYHTEHDEYRARYLIVGERRPFGIGRDVTGRRKDGSTFPIDLTVSELHDGSRRLLTGIIRDISERKSLQQELLSIAEEEQRRIGQDLHDDVGQELTGLAMKAEPSPRSWRNTNSRGEACGRNCRRARSDPQQDPGAPPEVWFPSRSIQWLGVRPGGIDRAGRLARSPAFGVSRSVDRDRCTRPHSSITS
jgi:PAS domain S-box-containing protein